MCLAEVLLRGECNTERYNPPHIFGLRLDAPAPRAIQCPPGKTKGIKRR
jgi:hypothetical protein